MLSEIFLSFLVASVSALCGITLKLCYDSKCKKIELCCIKIERDTKAELNEDKYKIDHGMRPKEIELPTFKEPENI